MKTLTFRITTTPAAREAIREAPPNDPRRVRICVARIDLRTTALDLIRAVPLPTRGLERAGAAAFVTDERGNRVTHDRLLRQIQGIPPVTGIIREFESRSGKKLIAWSGAGNLAQNDGCIGYQDGKLTCREQEFASLARGQPYPSLVLMPDDTARMPDVTFTSALTGSWQPSVPAKVIVSGQLLVRDGSVMDSYGDEARRQAYCDKRHLIRFPYCHLTTAGGEPALDEAGKPLQRDFGLDRLISDERLLNSAIESRVVFLPLNVCDLDGTQYQILASDLKRALHEKGYEGVNTPASLQNGDRGRYYLGEDSLQIVFSPTPYPQHVVALCPGEPHHVYEIVIGGWSNNAGVTIATLSDDLAAAGFASALLLDNGGDAVFVEGANDPNSPKALIPSSLRRTQWAGIIAYSSRSAASAQIEYGRAEHDNGSDTLKVNVNKKLSA